jgi:hypothetical protein
MSLRRSSGPRDKQERRDGREEPLRWSPLQRAAIALPYRKTPTPVGKVGEKQHGVARRDPWRARRGCRGARQVATSLLPDRSSEPSPAREPLMWG